MIANRMKPLLFAAALAASLSSAASASDNALSAGAAREGYHGHHSGNGRPDHVRQIRRFSDHTLGGISRATSGTSRDAGGRSSFATPGFSGSNSRSAILYLDDDRIIYSAAASQQPTGPYLAPKTKIIDVAEATAQGNFAPVNGCSYEMGVCVIRGEK